jgi:NAD(P)-dependent dehydrogenase (short-subunit alcohol dehydrogenase family)
MIRFDSNYWAVIIGGSSGFGLATAKKLACHGMNLCIVHRDRRGSMKAIQPHFDAIKEMGVNVLTFNTDALSDEGRSSVVQSLQETLKEAGKVRMILHAVAFGNLKLLTPYVPSESSKTARNRLAEALHVSTVDLDRAVETLWQEGVEDLHGIVTPPLYNNEMMLDKGDFERTLQAMGSNIIEWVQDLHARQLFAKDARVLSLTSEGNTIAWKGYAAVSAAKAVLESVSRAMAVEFAPYGIRSNVIQAGVTDTPALRAIPGSAHIKAKARLRNPMGRLTEPEDVANFIFLLCMDEAAWVNGSLICVDGGERIA